MKFVYAIYFFFFHLESKSDMVKNCAPNLPTTSRFETSRHDAFGDFPPNFKRPKVDAIRQYPLGFNAAAFQARNILCATNFVRGSSCNYAKPFETSKHATNSFPYTSSSRIDHVKSKENSLACIDRESNVKKDDEKSLKENGDSNKLMDALNLFNVIVEEVSKEFESKSNAKKPTIYVEAAMRMKKQKQWVNTEKQFGVLAGVNIGDKFRYRAELVVIGLHCCFQSGIDFVIRNGEVQATSIVDSGRYEDEKERSDVFIYCGQGGNPNVGKSIVIEDQKLERGNLALYNSMLAKNPIRVIRGIKRKKKNTPKYNYDGLYIVNKFWEERGQFGKLVFKFQLQKISSQAKVNPRGQSQIISRKLKESKRTKFELKELCPRDISQGKENMPIRVVNTIDDKKPPSFEYMTNVIYSESGCNCFDGCSEKCPCVLKNGGEFPFNNNGAIVYECGPSCKCSSSCYNRVSQHGIKVSLEVFKTKSKGWGVRSRDYIPFGSFICEYVGEFLHDNDAEKRIDCDEYLFDISSIEDDGFTIDAAYCGNVARFINHSCSPNLYAINVLYDNDDKRSPHIMLFSTKNIAPLSELTYNYNYKIGSVCDHNGNIKIKNCYCGSLTCRGRMY